MNNFIRAEYIGRSGHNFRYFWKCNRCEKEYFTANGTTSGYCDRCLKDLAAERKSEAEKNHLKKARKQIARNLKLRFEVNLIPCVMVNGEKYLLEKAVMEKINEFIEEVELDG